MINIIFVIFSLLCVFFLLYIEIPNNVLKRDKLLILKNFLTKFRNYLLWINFICIFIATISSYTLSSKVEKLELQNIYKNNEIDVLQKNLDEKSEEIKILEAEAFVIRDITVRIEMYLSSDKRLYMFQSIYENASSFSKAFLSPIDSSTTESIFFDYKIMYESKIDSCNSKVHMDYFPIENMKIIGKPIKYLHNYKSFYFPYGKVCEDFTKRYNEEITLNYYIIINGKSLISERIEINLTSYKNTYLGLIGKGKDGLFADIENIYLKYNN